MGGLKLNFVLTHWGRDKFAAISQTADDILKWIFLNENV